MIRIAVVPAIVIAMLIPASATDTATKDQCQRVIALLDRNPALERSDPFHESLPVYVVGFDAKGSMTITCDTGPVDFVIGINTTNPSGRFMTIM
jgi:hypothetical protein